MKRNFAEWLLTFTDSIANYKYYIDFETIYKNAEIYKVELNMMNSLIGSKKIEKELLYPMFVKPSNSGSSVGVNKANNKEELERAISHAGEFDKKILVEQGIFGKEIETAVLGNEEIIVRRSTEK